MLQRVNETTSIGGIHSFLVKVPRLSCELRLRVSKSSVLSIEIALDSRLSVSQLSNLLVLGEKI